MRTTIVMATIFSMTVLPSMPTASAGVTKTEPVALQNVELNADGAVEGTIVDQTGTPSQGTRVQVRTKTAAAEAVTNAEGKFVLRGVEPGNCALTIGDRTYGCRLWSHRTAPPKALTSFIIVHSNGPVVRGQDYCGEGCDTGGGRGFLGGPLSGGQVLGLGLLAGAVVAIAIAANNDSSN